MPVAYRDLVDIIKQRRNTKNFKDREVSRSDIEILIDSAVWAPNHRSTEPWKFFVIPKNSDMREKIGQGLVSLQEESTGKALSEDQKSRIKAQFDVSTTLVFCFSAVDDNTEITEENYAAVCCAIQNIQLVAESLGLGVGWSTGRIAKIKNLKDIFGIEQELKVAGVLTVGYPDDRALKNRKDFKLSTKWL